MDIKTKGIILQATKYGEKSLILKIYTENKGLQSFIIKNAFSIQSKKAKNALYQPLNLVNIDYLHKENATIHYFKEINISYQYKTLPYQIEKSSIGLFMCELLINCLRIEQQEQNLFDFVYHSLEFLDTYEDKISNFHLHFAMQLTHFLGFFPKDNYTELNPYFDMIDGTYMSMQPIHKCSIDSNLTPMFDIITRKNIIEICQLTITNNIRKELLNKIIEYYK